MTLALDKKEAIRCERIQTQAMSPRLDGDGNSYIEVTYDAYAWKCPDCGLVWEKRWHAEKCAERKHVSVWSQLYCDGTLNGQPIRPRYYERRAIRRDTIK